MGGAMLLWMGCATSPQPSVLRTDPMAVPRDVQLVQSVPDGTSLADPTLPSTQRVWIQMIRSATRSIDWAAFYVASAPGEALEPILRELAAAAVKGVRVRFLIDKQMAKNDPQTLGFLERMPGATVRLIDFNLVASGSHHAKYFVVDGKEVFLGSQNFDWRSLSQIHELGVRIAHPHIAGQLAFLFEMDFALARDRNDTLESNPPVMPRGPAKDIEVGVSPPQLTPDGIRPALPVLLDVIRAARYALSIQLLRYSAHQGSEQWDSLQEELRQAAARGVRVQLLVSNWSTQSPEIQDLKELSRFPNIEVRIATIPEVPGRFIPYARVIHSKYAVADDQILWLGTTNWERGMFMSSRNVDVVLRRSEQAKQANRVFLQLWNASYCTPIDLQKEYVPPRLR
jgi:phosphatidylserine/phosphatidylglycerophosphate/cardiolipin synthase-like enzyme